MINLPTIEEYREISDKFNIIERNETKDCSGKSLISVITITKNSQDTVEQTILSVINQNCKNVEHIIVDGGSTDNTLDIIAKYKHDISICISESDEGISDAFNKGISICSGDIVAIINSDDWYEPNVFNKVLEEFSRQDVDIIHGKMKRWLKKR